MPFGIFGTGFSGVVRSRHSVQLGLAATDEDLLVTTAQCGAARRSASSFVGLVGLDRWIAGLGYGALHRPAGRSIGGSS